MRLRLCYLGVLTVMCVLPIVMTVLGMTSKQWISFSITETENSKFRMDGENSPPSETSPRSMNIQLGLFTISMCIDVLEQQICIGTGNDIISNAMKFGATNTTNLTVDDAKAARVATGGFFTMITTLKALTIVGLIFQILGALLAMSFWRRSLELLTNARLVASAICWFVSGVSILGATGLALFINQEVKSFEIVSSTEETYSSTKTTNMRMRTAWALLFTGFAIFLAFATGVVVLMAKRFRVESHKYSPISLITYAKGRSVDQAQDGEMLLKPNGQEEEEENVRLYMHNEYHD